MNGVYLGDAQAVGHCRTGSRTTSRSHRNAQLRTGSIDEVLHNQEVTRKTHCLHDVQLKDQTLFHFIRQRIAVQPFSPVERQLGKIVGLQFDTVKLVVPSQTLNLSFGGIFIQNNISVLILRKLIKQVFLRISLPILFFRSKILGNSESRHDRRVVNRIIFHFVQNLQRIGKRFGNIRKEFVHLSLGFHPFLLGIEHTARIVQILARTQTDKAVVRLGILFVHKMDVIGTNHLYAILLGIFQQFGIGLLLQRISLVVGAGDGCLVALQLQIEIISKKILIPADSLFGLIQLVVDNLFRDLAADTGRADNQSFVVLLQFIAVGTRTHIVAHSPCAGHQLYKVVIPLFVLSQHNQVITALIGFAFFLVHRAARHIHLAADNGLEQLILGLRYFLLASRYLRFLVFTCYLTALYACNTLLQVFYFPFRTTVLFVNIVGELFDAKHVAMVGYGNPLHSILHRFVHQAAHAGLTIEKRILGMDV